MKIVPKLHSAVMRVLLFLVCMALINATAPLR